MLEAGRSSVPKHLPGLDARNPQDQLVTFDIVGHGTPREICPGDVIEAETELAKYPMFAGDRYHILPPLAELGAHIRVLIEFLLLAGEIDDAGLHSQLLGHLASMCLCYNLSAP